MGIDCVAMCVNDVICCGAKPLFFLDYIACGKNYPEKIAQIVAGVAEGCVQADCALIGGETAEMPGFYSVEEYDLAGFSVGVVDRERILDSASMQAGDAIIALPASGVHSNGFSLVRKVFDVENRDLNVYHEELGQTLGEALLTPTCIYVRPVQALLQGCTVRALAHITGGGFYENIPRSIPQGLCATIARADVRSLPVFALIARSGNIPERDMFNTFNMGVGMAAVVPGEQADQAVRLLQSQGVDAYILGEITRGEDKVRLV